MARSKLLLAVTQPSDGITYEHVIQFVGQSVIGYENLRDVDGNTPIQTLLRQIRHQSEIGGTTGPYTWKWID